MNTLKGVFTDTKPKYRRNFIQENVKQLRDIQGYWQNRDKQINAVITKPVTNKYRNVVSKIAPQISVSQPRKHEKKMSQEKMTGTSVSRALSSSTSSPNSSQNARSPKKIASQKKDKLGSCENISSTEVTPGRSYSRSLGCQTIDPRNSDDIYNEGVIRYPSSRKSPPLKRKVQGNKPPTREMGLQTERQPLSTFKNIAAGDTLQFCDNEEDENVDESSELSGVNSVQINLKKSPSRIRTPEHNPLKPPSSYQKGVVPKYLRERKEELQKEAEEQIKQAPDPACPPGHVSLPEGERIETLRVLRKSYTELVQELNTIPVRTDTLRMRNKKMELERQLDKIEQGIKVFSRPKVFVKIGV